MEGSKTGEATAAAVIGGGGNLRARNNCGKQVDCMVMSTREQPQKAESRKQGRAVLWYGPTFDQGVKKSESIALRVDVRGRKGYGRVYVGDEQC